MYCNAGQLQTKIDCWLKEITRFQ